MASTYKEAGIDVMGIQESERRIGRMISRTHRTRSGVRVVHGFGHYAGMVDLGDGTLLATHADGVGTKVMIANAMKRYDTIGIDCVAMNVNDVICTGARPVSFVDYIAASANDGKILEDIARGLAAGAKTGAVPIVGGETAIMPDLFKGDDFSFDLAGTVVGAVKKEDLVLGDATVRGDAIIGARSTGLHSNGYTLARKALQDRSLDEKLEKGKTLGEALLEPTEIYVKPVLKVLDKCAVHGLAHVTGGSFTKLLRLKKTGFILDNLPEIPTVMQAIQDMGVEPREMYSTFNMGIGFCIVAPREHENEIRRIFRRHGISSDSIGYVSGRKGVFIDSEKIA